MNDKKYIRFVDGDSNTLFHVPDGGSIKVHSAWDHQDRVLPCKYIDPYHVEISGNCYHISQFAELMERNGNLYEPVSEIGDLDFYEKKFLIERISVPMENAFRIIPLLNRYLIEAPAWKWRPRMLFA